MTRINSGHIFRMHCHGKRRQIKPEQLLPGDRIELVQPFLHRLAQVIAAAAERGVALVDEVTLLLGQCQRRAMAVGFRARDRP